MGDAGALAAAFKSTEGVFILPPSEFDPARGFPEARAVIAAATTALKAARPRHIVCLSTIGAQATQTNLLTQRTLLEQALRALPFPVTFLRPGWFMENFAWDGATGIDRRYGVTDARGVCTEWAVADRWSVWMRTCIVHETWR